MQVKKPQLVHSWSRQGVSIAAAKEFSADAAAAADLLDLSTFSTLKEEQKVSLKAFLGRRHALALLMTGFGKSFVKHRCAWWLARGAATCG